MTPILPPHVQQALLRLGTFADDICFLKSYLSSPQQRRPNPTVPSWRDKQSAKSIAWKAEKGQPIHNTFQTEKKGKQVSNKTQGPSDKMGHADRVLARLEEYRRNRVPFRSGRTYGSGNKCGRCGGTRQARNPAPHQLADTNKTLKSRPTVETAHSQPRFTASTVCSISDSGKTVSENLENDSTPRSDRDKAGQQEGHDGDEESDFLSEMEDDEVDESAPTLEVDIKENTNDVGPTDLGQDARNFHHQRHPIHDTTLPSHYHYHGAHLHHGSDKPETQFDRSRQPNNFNFPQPSTHNIDWSRSAFVHQDVLAPAEKFGSEYHHEHHTSHFGTQAAYDFAHPCFDQHNNAYLQHTTPYPQHYQFPSNEERPMGPHIYFPSNECQPTRPWEQLQYMDQNQHVDEFQGDHQHEEEGYDDEDIGGDRWDEYEDDYHDENC